MPIKAGIIAIKKNTRLLTTYLQRFTEVSPFCLKDKNGCETVNCDITRIKQKLVISLSGYLDTNLA